MNESPCPQCGELAEDPIGLGVQHCESCGYCTHAIELNEGGRFTCKLCGRVRGAEAQGGRATLIGFTTDEQREDLKKRVREAINEWLRAEELGRDPGKFALFDSIAGALDTHFGESGPDQKH